MARFCLALLVASILAEEFGEAGESASFGENSNAAQFRWILSLRTWPTAPSDMLTPIGKAISSTQIKLRWIEPTYPNGILRPYHVEASTYPAEGQDPNQCKTQSDLSSAIRTKPARMGGGRVSGSGSATSAA
ncbi:hypothetical protein TcWFU_010085 [Taenia crassiceps]|uniref:Uncharacterized protein n=1 Tax=Taenia crassiceps TaxID=6207 RepID=A0ABR4PZ36_9CEST